MAVEPKSVKQENGAVLTIGRYQPPTSGHVKVIEQMINENPDKTPIVCIVKGKTSSKDKEKNPFDYDIQAELLKKGITKNIITIPVSSGYLGDIIDKVRNEAHLEPEILAVGEDRIETFQKAIGRYGEIFNCDMHIMPINRPEDDISATQVRQSLINNDYNTFSRMTTNLTEEDFNNLRELYLSANE